MDKAQETKRQKIDRLLNELEGAIDFNGNGADLLHMVRKQIQVK